MTESVVIDIKLIRILDLIDHQIDRFYILQDVMMPEGILMSGKYKT